VTTKGVVNCSGNTLLGTLELDIDILNAFSWFLSCFQNCGSRSLLGVDPWVHKSYSNYRYSMRGSAKSLSQIEYGCFRNNWMQPMNNFADFLYHDYAETCCRYCKCIEDTKCVGFFCQYISIWGGGARNVCTSVRGCLHLLNILGSRGFTEFKGPSHNLSLSDRIVYGCCYLQI
jgi:hypothetical protein